MGYCGLDNWSASDSAADCFCGIVESTIKQLKKNIKTEKGNQYNTNGIVNAALIIKDLGPAFWLDWEFREYVEEDFIPIFEKYIKEQSADKEWREDDASGKSWHMKYYRQMLRKIKSAVERE